MTDLRKASIGYLLIGFVCLALLFIIDSRPSPKAGVSAWRALVPWVLGVSAALMVSWMVLCSTRTDGTHDDERRRGSSQGNLRFLLEAGLVGLAFTAVIELGTTWGNSAQHAGSLPFSDPGLLVPFAGALVVLIGLALSSRWFDSVPRALHEAIARQWQVKAGDRSTTMCAKCESPLSMLGTLHCQAVTGTIYRDQFVAEHGVFCHMHAAEFLYDYVRENGISAEDVALAFEVAQAEYARISMKGFPS